MGRHGICGWDEETPCLNRKICGLSDRVLINSCMPRARLVQACLRDFRCKISRSPFRLIIRDRILGT